MYIADYIVIINIIMLFFKSRTTGNRLKKKPIVIGRVVGIIQIPNAMIKKKMQK